MKIRQQVYISDMERFIAGDYRWTFNIMGREQGKDLNIAGWHHVGEVWIDVEMSKQDMVLKAIDDLDKEEDTIKADVAKKLDKITARRQELLTIEHQETPNGES